MPRPARAGEFDYDTGVNRVAGHGGEEQRGRGVSFAAEISPDWQAGRGPHGGYLAAMLLRALTETVADRARTPRSLTIHYARAPVPGPVSIHAVIEREGRSLSTLSARMEREGALIALALAAFSVPWDAPEIAELQMPDLPPPDRARETSPPIRGAPPFTRHLVMQRRIGALPFTGAEHAMETGGWLGLAEPRPIDALSLAFFSDALIPTPFFRLREPMAAPTIDLTVHFRTPMPRVADPDPDELCLAHFRSRLLHEGFFEEDGAIWASDGTLLAQSRQLAILIPWASS